MQSPNQPTIPQEPIYQITSTHPNNPSSPFWNENGDQIPPLAKLTIERKRLYERPCDAEYVPEDDEEDDTGEGLSGAAMVKGTCEYFVHSFINRDALRVISC